MLTRLWLIVLCAVILHQVDAFYPHESYTDDDPEKFVDPSEDYEEKVAGIFGNEGVVPVSEDARERLDSCTHVVCVPYFLCINEVVIANSTSAFEWRSITNEDKDIICDDLEVPCCADKVKAAAISSVDDPNNVDEMVEHTDTEQIDDLTIVPSIGQCGFQFNGRYPLYRRLIARAVQSETAQPMEFPWMVGIFKRLNNGRLQYLGGGSIIHSYIVLTAAHFLVHRVRPDQLVIRAGVHDILHPMSLNERHQQQQRDVNRLLIHEDFHASSLSNDIALIVVNKPLEWNRYVNPICLPPPNMRTTASTECMASGWGKDATGRSGTYQRLLQKIDLPIVEARRCQRILRSTKLGPYFRLHSSLLCAGGLGRDTCKGDGGSPLVCPIPYLNNRFYQCGIVAGGIGCGGHIPAMYVNVAHFVDWINDQLWQLNLNIDRPNVLSYNLFDTNYLL